MTSPVSGPHPETPVTGPTPVDLRVRTAPKIFPFLGAGFVLAALVALIAAWFSHASLVEAAEGGAVEFSFMAVFGFFLVTFGVVGVGVGALAFLLTDRLGRRREKTVRVLMEPVDDSTSDA